MQLVALGAASIGLGYLVFVLAKPLATTTLIAGLAGGALCFLAGIRALQGVRQKTLPLLTLIPLTIVLVSQAVMTWGAGTPEIPDRGKATAAVGLLVVLCFGMLMRVAYAGLSPIGPSPTPAKPSVTRQGSFGAPPVQAETGKP